MIPKIFIQAGINGTMNGLWNASSIQECIESCKREKECFSYLIEADGENLISCYLMEDVPDGATVEPISPLDGTSFYWGLDTCLKVSDIL